MATFKDLGVRKEYIQGLKELGIKVPTEIQENVIPTLLKSKTDLIGLAQTGTGKTAAFGLPILHNIDSNSDKVQALILAPTRELAQQIKKYFLSSQNIPNQKYLLKLFLEVKKLTDK